MKGEGDVEDECKSKRRRDSGEEQLRAVGPRPGGESGDLELRLTW